MPQLQLDGKSKTLNNSQKPNRNSATLEPLVSVVIPLYNAAGWIQDAIQSVQDQTYKNWELIVVNDGSTDTGIEKIREVFKFNENSLLIIETENSGPAKARNRGILESKGDLVAFLDSDDIWHSRKLEIQIEKLNQSIDSIGVGCDYEIFSDRSKKSKGVVRVKWSSKMVRKWIAFEGYGALLPSTVVVKRATVDEMGGFNENLELSTDLDFASRLVEIGTVATVARSLVFYRHRAGQMHRDYELLRKDYSLLLTQESFQTNKKLTRRISGNLEMLVAIHQLVNGQWKQIAHPLRRVWELNPRSLILLPLYLSQRVLLRKLRGLAWFHKNN